MKLTSREQKIIEVLMQDPLISQEDLAARFGISRSSVAVHISNLMKKGVILGKGYVFNKKASAVVAGEVFLRVNISDGAFDCRIDTEFSGFALEVSQALVNYGMVTKLLTVLGSDDAGSQIISRLKSQEVDVNNVIRARHHRTSRKVFVDGELRYAEAIDRENISTDLESRAWLLQNCDWLLIDEPYQEMLAQQPVFQEENGPVVCTCHYWQDDLPACLQQYHLVVLGVANFNKLEQIQQRGLELVQAEVQNCIVTDGKSMILCFGRQNSQDFTLLPNQSFDNRNDLHLFLAGLVYGLAAGYPMRQAIRIATASASKNEI